MRKLSEKIYVFTITNGRTRDLNSRPLSQLVMNITFRFNIANVPVKINLNSVKKMINIPYITEVVVVLRFRIPVLFVLK